MPFVPDASAILAWHFRDEHSALAEAVAARSFSDRAIVPQHWPLEVANALLRGERRQRSLPKDIDRFIVRLQAIDLEIETMPADDIYLSVLPLARRHRLSIYDAAYLELASRRELPLATLDGSLAEAAQSIGVELIQGE